MGRYKKFVPPPGEKGLLPLIDQQLREKEEEKRRMSGKPQNFEKTKKSDKPATELMKKVAIATGDTKRMKKAFSREEILEIMARRTRKETITSEENGAARSATRANKKWVKAQSAGDYSKLYFYPSYTSADGDVWYKALDFSALYYSYILAPRMGRTANIYDDRDSYSRSKYIASVKEIDDMAEDFKTLDGGTVEITLSGIYVFTLAHPQTAEDFARLIRTEEERRDKARNMLRPAKMAPATFKTLVDFIVLITPKIKSLERRDFFSVGEHIIHALEEIMMTYYMYSDGHLSTEETGERILERLNMIKAGMTIMQEMDGWDSVDTAAMLGESLMFFRDQVINDFKLKIGKVVKKNDKPGV